MCVPRRGETCRGGRLVFQPRANWRTRLEDKHIIKTRENLHWLKYEWMILVLKSDSTVISESTTSTEVMINLHSGLQWPCLYGKFFISSLLQRHAITGTVERRSTAFRRIKTTANEQAFSKLEHKTRKPGSLLVQWNLGARNLLR